MHFQWGWKMAQKQAARDVLEQLHEASPHKIPLPGVYQETPKLGLERDLHTDVRSTVTHSSQKWKHPKPPLMEEWLSEMWSMHTKEVIQP